MQETCRITSKIFRARDIQGQNSNPAIDTGVRETFKVGVRLCIWWNDAPAMLSVVLSLRLFAFLLSVMVLFRDILGLQLSCMLLVLTFCL